MAPHAPGSAPVDNKHLDRKRLSEYQVSLNRNPANWPQNREKTEFGDEVWRLAKTAQQDWPDLCSMCRTINFRAFLDEDYRMCDNRDEAPIGYLDEIWQKEQECSFCRLAVNTIRERTGCAELPELSDGSRIKCDLRRQYGVSYQLIDDGFSPHPAIRLVTIPILPSRYPNQTMHETLKPWNNARPLGTPVPWSMKSRDYFNTTTICDAADAEDPNLDCPAQIVSTWVNYGQIRDWLKRCDYLHHHGIISLPTGFRLIDVHRECLITQCCPETLYVALSYTWGRLARPFFRTTKSNIESLTRLGSISIKDSQLPTTIRDAMNVVIGLGQSYLWVDSICIIQDDDHDMAEQVNAMNIIFSAATLTIVAVSGNDADAGLPGVPPTVRRGQHVANVQGLTLVNRLFSTREILDGSWWNTRAWTLQERILSTRMLVFSSSQLHLQCDHQTVCEDITSDKNYQTPRYPDSLPLVSSVISFYKYESAVMNYTSRNLSYNADGWNAFAGVGSYFRPLLRGGYVFGLPQTHFDLALLWHVKGEVHRRRGGEGHEILFPSWTWVAWSGPILFDREYRVSSRILFQNFHNEQNAYFCAQDILPKSDWEGWKRWTRPRRGYWRDDGNPPAMHFYPTLPEHERPPVGYCDPQTGYLKIWTQAIFSILSDDDLLPTAFAPDNYFDLTYESGTWRTLRSADGEVNGVIQLNVSGADVDLREPQPLILLSRTTRDCDSIEGPNDYGFAPETPGCSTNVMWDQRQFDHDAGDLQSLQPKNADSERNANGKQCDRYNVMLLDTLEGTCTRLGVGVMWLVAFHRAKPRRVNVILG